VQFKRLQTLQPTAMTAQTETIESSEMALKITPRATDLEMTESPVDRLVARVR